MTLVNLIIMLMIVFEAFVNQIKNNNFVLKKYVLHFKRYSW